MRRFAGILVVVTLAAVVLAAVLGGVSLVLYKLGFPKAQLALAGGEEILLSVVFLSMGLCLLFLAWRAIREKSGALISRLTLIVTAGMVGAIWTLMGIKGIISPRLLLVLFGID
ncbi:MAG TPA: hypothetical protein VL282_01695 [Tepidisphaeraceae bacterium]|nr:hypothetical protein [Tepidisphaeraceae bacterium]